MKMASNNIPIPLNDIACQALILSRSVAHHGNLRKRGMLNNLAEKVTVKPLNLDQMIRWRQYYVVLINGCIYIYNNETSSKPTHATSLCEFKGVEACDHEVAFGISWPFKLVSANDNKDHCYYFSAPSERDLQVWMKCINDQLLNLPKPVERQAIAAPIRSTPYKAEFRRTMGSNPPPPLPPPRGRLPEGQHYSVCKDEHYESMDIPEEATGVTKVAVGLLQSAPRNSFVNSFSADGSCPPQLPNPRASLGPDFYDNNLNPQKKLPAVPPKNPSGSKAYPRTHSLLDLSKTNESSMFYGGTAYYVELSKDDQLNKKSDIVTKAFWDGQPEDADLIMTHVTHNGAYMVRESSDKGTRTLLVRVGPSVVKYKILTDTSGRQSLLADGPHFDTLASLIVYYKSHSVPTRNVPLTLPYSAVESTF